ncbi:hypothetical protein [Streptomyces sp. NBC_01462]|uniref:hypothetical protein n=1 Tax=Streptomyces sp. NBC_01462 TaxID=2903876 RepID=UPI002E2F7918|nr:hypothetical protein [Streptomyces sp. NBC_01462]
MRKHLVLAATAAALGAGLLAAPSAQAGTDGMNPHTTVLGGPFLGWNANHHASNIKGASATGHEGPLDNGRVMVDGWLRDSVKGDGHAACVQIHAKYADGGTRDEWVYTSSADGKSIGPGGGYTFASSVRTIWVREGIGNGGHCTRMADGVYTIYPR